jgi:hypothetical protein
MSQGALPDRRDGQRLAGYVRENLAALEGELYAAVPWHELVRKVRLAGFPDAGIRAAQQALYRARKSVANGEGVRLESTAGARVEESPARPPTPREERPADLSFGKLYHDLVRARPPGSGETDPLV